MERKRLKADIFSVSMLFWLGESVCKIPNNLNIKSLSLVLLTALVFLILVTFFDKKIVVFIKQKPFLKIAIAIFLSLYALYCLIDTVNLFSRVFKRFALNEFSVLMISVIFLALGIYTALKGFRAYKKTATVFLAISVLFIAIIIVVSLGEINKENFNDIFKLPLNLDYKIFLQSGFSVGFLPLCFHLFNEKEYKKSMYYGVFSAGILLIVLGLIPILIFGSVFSYALDFPLFDAVGALSVGSVFTRIDAFSYFILFSGSLIKTALLIFVLIRLSKYLIGKIKSPVLNQ
ncbi:MAG: GerAB/ArcD/ProY family transporter [Oscillospiraceae bacterium]|nr:GerAB/ArcD/ProY family transporter [Oscillospiraceae bacterium]